MNVVNAAVSMETRRRMRGQLSFTSSHPSFIPSLFTLSLPSPSSFLSLPSGSFLLPLCPSSSLLSSPPYIFFPLLQLPHPLLLVFPFISSPNPPCPSSFNLTCPSSSLPLHCYTPLSSFPLFPCSLLPSPYTFLLLPFMLPLLPSPCFHLPPSAFASHLFFSLSFLPFFSPSVSYIGSPLYLPLPLPLFSLISIFFTSHHPPFTFVSLF